MTPLLALVIAVVSLLADLTLIIAFILQRQSAIAKAATEKGRLVQTITDIGAGLDRAHEKIRLLQDERQSTAVSLASLQKDMEHVVKTTDEIRTRLEKHMDGGAA